MAQTPQSSKPSVFMPWFQTQVATGLGLSSTDFVQIVSEDTDKWPAFATEQIQATVWLSPPIPQPDSGAGRYAYFIQRRLLVSIWTRGGLDTQGSDSISLLAHWDYEDTLINALLLKMPVGTETPRINFHRVLKLVEDPGVNRLYKVDAAKYKSTLGFLVTYSAPVTV